MNTNKTSVFDTLSEKQMIVLKLVLEGKSTTDIAEILHLSPKTVSTFRMLIREKVHAANDVELILLAVREGLIGKAA